MFPPSSLFNGFPCKYIIRWLSQSRESECSWSSRGYNSNTCQMVWGLVSPSCSEFESSKMAAVAAVAWLTHGISWPLKWLAHHPQRMLGNSSPWLRLESLFQTKNKQTKQAKRNHMGDWTQVLQETMEGDSPSLSYRWETKCRDLWAYCFSTYDAHGLEKGDRSRLDERAALSLMIRWCSALLRWQPLL